MSWNFHINAPYELREGIVHRVSRVAVVAAFLFWNAGEFDSPVLWLPMGAVLLHMLVGAGGLIEDVRYSRALKRHAAALAGSWP